MSTHYQTAPEDRISIGHRVIYGLGAFVNNLLAAASGGMMIVLNLGFGMNPALVGLLGALPRTTDALTDPLMGYISDNTRSRWGRRRPYIFVGAILAGVIFALLWQLPEGKSETFYFVFFLIGSFIFYLAYTVFATPWVALGYELTPDYHERTRLMGTQNFIGQLAYVASPWFLWIMSYEGFFDNQADGAAGLAIIIAVVTIGIGVLPALFLRERFSDTAATEQNKEKVSIGQNIRQFFAGFLLVLKSKPFLLLCVATFMVFNGFMLISSFQFYVIIYYVFGGDQVTGAEYAGYAGSVGAIATFAVVVLATWLGTKMGKRRAFILTTAVSIVGYGMKWFSYNPEIPWLVILPAPLLAFGLGGLFTLMPAMVADMVDLDELSTWERREGMFGSIFWWVVKLGMALALAGGGYLLNATGFDVALGPDQSEQTVFLLRLFDVVIPMLTSGIAIWAVWKFPITEEKAHEVRKELESRRGKIEPDMNEVMNNMQDTSARLRKRINDKGIPEKVERLLASMSLAEKVGQMTQPDRAYVSPQQVREWCIGSILSGGGSLPGDNVPADWVAMQQAYWEASMDDTNGRTAVPLMYGVDAIHGHNNVRGAVIFPHNIGLGAADDPELIERIAQITAREVLTTGLDWTFAPTLAVARDRHWGRSYESYSENPALVKKYARGFVRGLQQDLGNDAVVACAKHWVGDGGTRGGVDQGDTVVSFTELEGLHISPYYEALDEGVLTVMASYSSWNGSKCHGHRFLLTDVLKERLGFEGFIVSDWNGIDQLDEDYAAAIVQSVNAGIDMFMVPETWQAFIETLIAKVESGEVSTERIDDAVRRILTVKYLFGLFDKPAPAKRKWSNSDQFGSAAHRETAREAVRKSLVLLKNEGGHLPMQQGTSLLVAGRAANSRGHLCGGFSIEWQGSTGNEIIEGGTSVWEAISKVVPGAVLSESGEATDSGTFDVALVVIGEDPYAEGMGDVRDDDKVAPGSSLLMPAERLKPYSGTLVHKYNHPEDLALINRIRSKGIPVITLFVSGRPVIVNDELEQSDVFIAAWLPGSEGDGIADVLTGQYDFQGKLSFSWPRNVGEQPNVGDEDYNPLYPFGHGLRMKG